MILGYLVRCRDKGKKGNEDKADWELQSVELVTLKAASAFIGDIAGAYPWMETQLVEVHVPNNLLTFKVDGRVIHVAE